MSVKSVTGGVVTTAEQTSKLDLSLQTGGVYEGSKTITQNSSLFIKAGGEASVNTINVLNVKIFLGAMFLFMEHQNNENKTNCLEGELSLKINKK